MVPRPASIPMSILNRVAEVLEKEGVSLKRHRKVALLTVPPEIRVNDFVMAINLAYVSASDIG